MLVSLRYYPNKKYRPMDPEIIPISHDMGEQWISADKVSRIKLASSHRSLL